MSVSKTNFVTLKPISTSSTVVCIAGGCSLTKDQVEATKGLFTIAINDAYKMAPWANVLYACDVKWWEWHEGCPDFKGWRLTHEFLKRADGDSIRPPYPGIDVILSTGELGYDSNPSYIRHGGNSGYQALHIAMHMRPKNIILLGYDMHNRSGKYHWFGRHPKPYDQPDDLRFTKWLKCFDTLVKPAKELGINIINCTPNSALECFQKMELNKWLKDNMES